MILKLKYFFCISESTYPNYPINRDNYLQKNSSTKLRQANTSLIQFINNYKTQLIISLFIVFISCASHGKNNQPKCLFKESIIKRNIDNLSAANAERMLTLCKEEKKKSKELILRYKELSRTITSIKYYSSKLSKDLVPLLEKMKESYETLEILDHQIKQFSSLEVYTLNKIFNFQDEITKERNRIKKDEKLKGLDPHLISCAPLLSHYSDEMNEFLELESNFFLPVSLRKTIYSYRKSLSTANNNFKEKCNAIIEQIKSINKKKLEIIQAEDKLIAQAKDLYLQAFWRETTKDFRESLIQLKLVTELNHRLQSISRSISEFTILGLHFKAKKKISDFFEILKTIQTNLPQKASPALFNKITSYIKQAEDIKKRLEMRLPEPKAIEILPYRLDKFYEQLQSNSEQCLTHSKGFQALWPEIQVDVAETKKLYAMNDLNKKQKRARHLMSESVMSNIHRALAHCRKRVKEI